MLPTLFAALRTGRGRGVQFSEHPLGARTAAGAGCWPSAARPATLRVSAAHISACSRNRSAAAARSETPSFRTIASDMHPDRDGRQHQPPGDFAGRLLLGQQGEDLPLSAGQPLAQAAIRDRLAPAGLMPAELLEHVRDQRTGDGRLTREHPIERVG